MNVIKKSIEQIPLPDKLHKVAYERLNNTSTKRAKRWMLPTVAMLFLILSSTTIVFSNYFSISDFFESKDQKLSAIDETKIVVESDTFSITLKQFVDYKENILLIHELNNIANAFSDMELLNQLIETELLLYEAKDHGVIATTQEINEYALQTKQAWAETNDASLHEINEELARKLGVDVEEYFTHPTTLKNYESMIISNNFIMQLYSEGILNEQYTQEQYKTDLHGKYKKQINVNKDYLKEAEGL